MAVGSISLASLLGLSKRNEALLSGHPAFEYGEENSLDERPRFVRRPLARTHNDPQPR